MGKLDYKPFSKRHRPHIHPLGGTLFLTYRLAGSIPKAKVREYKSRKERLENQLKQARKEARGGDRAGLKEWVERVEKFNREWRWNYCRSELSDKL